MGIFDIETDDAFNMFFDDMIGYKATRLSGEVTETSLYACIFPIEDIDPLDDISLESEVKKISITIINGGNGWVYDYPPQVGDEITLQDSSKWKVSKVVRMHSWYALTAKSV